MTTDAAPTRRKIDRNGCLKWAAGLTTSGLAIETLSLRWSHPTAFLLFILGGGTLVAMGAAAYLWALFRTEAS